jgi:ATP-dependent Clp protease protease subunit
MTTIFDDVESFALSRQDPPADQVPSGVPEDELGRIQKWRAANKAAFAAKASDTEVELSIIGVIGGGWLGDGISARGVKRWLDENKDAKNIRVLVDSPGGDYFDGAAIMNLLKRHQAKVTVEVIGEASSAGSVIAMGGDDIEMHAGTVMMIHRAWSIAIGNGDDIRATASMLDKVDDALASIYAARTQLPRAEVDALVAATTHMSAKEAVDKGFADRELPAKQKAKPVEPGATRTRASSGAPIFAAGNPAPTTPPGSAARQDPQPNHESEDTIMKFPQALITALALNEDADEAAVVAAVNKLKATNQDLKVSAKVGTDIEQLLGVSGQAAVGAVRALKDSHEANEGLAVKVANLTIVNVRREFEGAIAGGTKDRKLSPAVAKHYNDRFESALKLAQGDDGDADKAAAKAEEITADLKGFLAVAPRIVNANIGGPPPTGAGSSDGQPMQHQGKTFEDMAPVARKNLKDQNPDLYNTLREDAVSRGAI